jgi:hypothetical protein
VGELGFIMPKRNIPSGETDIFTHVERRESKGSYRGRKIVGGLAIAAAAVGGVGSLGALSSEFGTPVAKADTNIIVGGNGDTDSSMMVGALQNNGDYNYGANNIPVGYSASIGPIGPVPMKDSVAEGADRVMEAYHANVADPNIRIEGFSLGAIVVDISGNRIAAENNGVVPGNVTLVTDGNADTGLFQNQLAQTFAPLVEGFGIDMNNRPQPGTIDRNDTQDFWGSTANDDIGTAANKLFNMGNHRIPAQSEPHATDVDAQGVVNEWYGAPADPAALEPAPAPVDAPAPDFFAPPPAPAPEFVNSPAPSFFGEQPCVATDGSEYFTPGDASC